MTTARWMTWASLIAFAVATAGCGGDDDDSGGSTGGTGSGTGGAGGGTGGTTSGTQTLAGSCDVAGMGFCLDMYCVGTDACNGYVQGGPAGCTPVDGTWSTTACLTANSIGSCRAANGNGDVVTTYYSGGLTDATTAESSCTDGGNTFTPAGG